jgi:hypothetical protein
MAKQGERGRLDQGHACDFGPVTEGGRQAYGATVRMPIEVDSAVGALDDGLDDVDLPFDRNVVRRPALFGVAITEQARCHRPKAIS